MKAEVYNSPEIDGLLSNVSPGEMNRAQGRMLLAARIDDEIKKRGWKKKDFADALGKTPSEITKWLSGTHNFTADTLFDIERVMDIKLFNLESEAEVSEIYTYHVLSNLPRINFLEPVDSPAVIYRKDVQVPNLEPEELCLHQK